MRPSSVAVFCSSDQMPRTADQHYPYRQDSHLFALSGLTQPGTILVLFKDTPTAVKREWAFILPEDPEHAIWNGDRYSPKEARGISGIRTMHSTEAWDKIMTPIFRKVKNIYIESHDSGNDAVGFTAPNTRMKHALSAQYPDLRFISSLEILTQMLMVKHKVELGLMGRAIDVTGMAFHRALESIRPGIMEYELEAELTYTLARQGCVHAFEPIIASGKSACTLHYVRNDRIIGKEDLVLIDFGAEYAGMAADMTRTIPASGRFTKRQKTIYNAVYRILNEVTGMMRPGMTFPELNKETAKLIERELVGLKILSTRDLKRQDLKSPLYRKYFMHGIGHHLGYDVHDLTDRKAAFKPGMVITCEPGLYIREEGIGIRLENDILITRGTPKNLMKTIPIEAEHIEDLMNP